jgi:hypothetical protein
MRRQKKLRKLTLGESMALFLLAGDIEETVDADLANLVRRCAGGDDTALVPAVDRLKEIGRDDQAERLKKLLTR